MAWLHGGAERDSCLAYEFFAASRHLCSHDVNKVFFNIRAPHDERATNYDEVQDVFLALDEVYRALCQDDGSTERRGGSARRLRHRTL